MKLFAPVGYWKLTPKEKENICNGAGPKGWGWLVPDAILGLSITPAADIHDYMYSKLYLPWDNESKAEADRVFLNNMMRIIQGAYDDSSWIAKKTYAGILRDRRVARAHIYYEAVVKGGGPSYWADKNKENEEKTV